MQFIMNILSKEKEQDKEKNLYRNKMDGVKLEMAWHGTSIKQQKESQMRKKKKKK